MVDEIVDEKRRELLRTSAVALSGVVAGGSAMATTGAASAPSTAVKEPAASAGAACWSPLPAAGASSVLRANRNPRSLEKLVYLDGRPAVLYR